jgi:dihydrofolate synthase/folylpolyglutamate synthase
MRMTYEQAIEFWFGRVNYEQRSPQPTDLKLDRIRALLGLLGNPQSRLRIVHVAGSKGKGSTSAMLASILRQAGYRTGLFTSPHLCRVEERIQVDGTPITANELAALMEDVKSVVHAVDRTRTAGGAAVTFFEVATALGFLHFVRRRVEVAVVEVGLGGRFDSTNVCRPAVAVITSISIDHTQQLGNTLASIASEKAGILKPGCPAVSGVLAPEARAVIQQISQERGVALRQLGIDFTYRYEPGLVTNLETRPSRVEIYTRRRHWPVTEMGLLGEHQAANAAVAVAVTEELRSQGLWIADRAVAAGLGRVAWPARLDVLGRRPLVVVDCAHNLASAEALVEALRVSFPANMDNSSHGPRRHLIFAGSGDKDLPGMLRVLIPHFSDLYLTRYGSSSRSVPPAELGEMVRRISEVKFTAWHSAEEAWRAAQAAAGPEELMCITGSVFLAGELWAHVKAEKESG